MAGEYNLQAISFSNMLKTVMQFDPRNINGMFTLETGVTGTYHAFKKEKTLPSVQTKTTRSEERRVGKEC